MKNLLTIVLGALFLTSLTLDTQADEVTFQKEIHTVVGLSAFTGEVVGGELWPVLSFKKVMDVEAGTFIFKAKTLPGGGLGLHLKEAVEALGAAYEWKLGAFDPEIGFSLAINLDKITNSANTDRLVEVIVHARLLNIKF